MPNTLRPLEEKLPNFNFIVEIDGVQSTNFMEASGIERETELIEHREGGDTTTMRKFRGITKFPPLVLRRGQTSDQDLYNKSTLTFDAFLSAGGSNARDYKFSLYLVQLDNSGEEALRWKFVNAWVQKFSLNDFDASASEVAVEEVTIEHEGWFLERSSGAGGTFGLF